MIRQKRGASVLILFRATEIVLLGVAILCLLMIGFKLGETTYEKNLIARDMALLIDTIYASPGDVEYTYYLREYGTENKAVGGEKVDYPMEKGFDFEIKDSKVIVYDRGFKKPRSYRFIEKHGYTINDFEAQGPRAVKFVKKENKIEIEALY